MGCARLAQPSLRGLAEPCLPTLLTTSPEGRMTANGPLWAAVRPSGPL